LASSDDAVGKMRKICLSLPDTRERDHFGEAGFYVKGKLFAACGKKNGVCEITFGLEPDHAAALVRRDPRFKPYPRDKSGVVLDAADVGSWNELEALIVESYDLRKGPKRQSRAAKRPASRTRTRR
jgi:predicted DNA-binding protein (MmcQ/YjbR family)